MRHETETQPTEKVATFDILELYCERDRCKWERSLNAIERNRMSKTESVAYLEIRFPKLKGRIEWSSTRSKHPHNPNKWSICRIDGHNAFRAIHELKSPSSGTGNMQLRHNYIDGTALCFEVVDKLLV